MFSLLIVLLSFSESLAIKCLFLNDGPSMVRHIVIDSNPNELKYYPFMISIDKCTGNWCLIPKNILLPKICIPKETKNIYIKEFDIITNKYEAEAMT